MEYFLISNSTDKKEVGRYIQTKGLPDGYTSKWFDAPNSMTKLTNDNFPKQDPDLIFELEPKTKLTDIVSASNISARGLLMNEKTKNIFEQFNLPEYKFYPATLIVKSNKLQYYWLHIINNSLNDIDYQKTEFYESNSIRIKIKELSINSKEGFFENKNNNIKDGNLISTNRLHIKYSTCDLLIFPLIHSDIIISNKLTEKLISNKIKGFELKNKFTITSF